MDTLLIGCPVQDRAWIIELWHHHIVQALKRLDFEIDVKFVFSCSKDDATLTPLYGLVESGEALVHWTEEPEEKYIRGWSKVRYERMVYVRNELLRTVRAYGPEYFISVDSDILVCPNSLTNLFATLRDKVDDGCWAVGGKVYLEEVGRRTPNYGYWVNKVARDNFKRPDSERVMKVDALMALKLMTPAAYNVDYSYHVHGEDLGWSANVQDAGGKLWWDGRETSKHVMTRDWLNIVDSRCGY